MDDPLRDIYSNLWADEHSVAYESLAWWYTCTTYFSPKFHLITLQVCNGASRQCSDPHCIRKLGCFKKKYNCRIVIAPTIQSRHCSLRLLSLSQPEKPPLWQEIWVTNQAYGRLWEPILRRFQNLSIAAVSINLEPDSKQWYKLMVNIYPRPKYRVSTRILSYSGQRLIRHTVTR